MINNVYLLLNVFIYQILFQHQLLRMKLSDIIFLYLLNIQNRRNAILDVNLYVEFRNQMSMVLLISNYKYDIDSMLHVYKVRDLYLQIYYQHLHLDDINSI